MQSLARSAVLVAAAALTLAGCAQAPEPDPAPTPRETTQPPEPTAEPPGPREPTGDLAAPWAVAFVGNSAIVSERDSGRILELLEDGSKRDLTTLGDVVHGGEGGLLGLAVTPEAEAEPGGGTDTGARELYAYSTGDGGNRVQRFPITGEPGALSLGEPETILDGLPSATSHNGGRIAFGPDGMLYVTVGDSSEPWLAQDLNSLAGKILRIAPDGAVPADNPFPGSPVFSYGHRNPQGIAWGPDGTMYSAELGEDTWDELNVIVAGKNYGWPEVEGAAGDERFVDPVQQWAPSEASPSGMTIAGDTIYIANLRGQVLRSVPLADLTAHEEHFAQEIGRIRDVTVAPDGRLWLLSNNTDGRVEPREGDDRFFDTGLVE